MTPKPDEGVTRPKREHMKQFATALTSYDYVQYAEFKRYADAIEQQLETAKGLNEIDLDVSRTDAEILRLCLNSLKAELATRDATIAEWQGNYERMRDLALEKDATIADQRRINAGRLAINERQAGEIEQLEAAIAQLQEELERMKNGSD